MAVAGMASWRPAAQAGDFCVRDLRVDAVDSSAPVTQPFLDRMKAIGISTIIRYYDHEDETLPGKTLRRGERDAIVMNGFKMGVVFQHGTTNSPPSPRCAAARTRNEASSSQPRMPSREAARSISASRWPCARTLMSPTNSTATSATP